MNDPVASFVVRFHSSQSMEEEKRYRIKVTHVQNEREAIFETFEDAMDYMKGSINYISGDVGKGVIPWNR